MALSQQNETNVIKPMTNKAPIFTTIVLLLMMLTSVKAYACTSVSVSGQITKDGRPMLFKNRDTSKPNNVAVLVKGEKFRYIGIVAASDMEPKSVWGGHNEAGFAIINTAAYNLNGCEGNDSNGDGSLMRRALEICSSLSDFEHLLDTLPKPMDLNSNFGVMDAQGGCAYYETNNHGYVKFDANDPTVAPNGYLMRTNHGMTGCAELDRGKERLMAITDFMANAQQHNEIDMEHLLTGIPRYLTHGLTKINLYDLMPQDEQHTKMFPFLDFIPRWSTSSAILVQGVTKGENPLHTISWTNIGWPLASVAMPLVISTSGKLPSIVGHGPDGSSWLCQQAMSQKLNVFSAKGGNNHDYIDISKLINHAGTGIAQHVAGIEKEVLKRGFKMIARMRKKGNPDAQLSDNYYQWVDEYVRSNY